MQQFYCTFRVILVPFETPQLQLLLDLHFFHISCDDFLLEFKVQKRTNGKRVHQQALKLKIAH